MCYQLESIQQEEEIVESFPDLGLAEHHVETHVAWRGQEVIRSQLSDITLLHSGNTFIADGKYINGNGKGANTKKCTVKLNRCGK